MKRLQRLEVKPETYNLHVVFHSAQRQGCVPGACVQRFCFLGCSCPRERGGTSRSAGGKGSRTGQLRRAKQVSRRRRWRGTSLTGTVRQGARTHGAAGVDRRKGRCLALLSPSLGAMPVLRGGSVCAQQGRGL